MKTTKSITIRFLPDAGIESVYMNQIASIMIDSIWLHIETKKGSCRFEVGLVESYTVQENVELNDTLERRVYCAFMGNGAVDGYGNAITRSKISAIKAYRDATGADLRNAKLAVERMIEDNEW